MIVLGINVSHNGSVALVRDGKVEVAIQAERLSRVKRQALVLESETKLIEECVDYCLKSAGVEHTDIESIAISTPWAVKKISDADLFTSIGGIPNKYKGTFYVPHHFSHMEYIVHFGNLIFEASHHILWSNL